MTKQTKIKEKGELPLILLLTALVSMGVLSISIYIPSLPNITAQFQTNSGDTQATLSFFLFGLAVGQLIHGPLSDRYGRRPIILMGLAIYIVTSVLCAFAFSIESLIVSRFLQGLGACTGPVIARAIIRDRFKDEVAVRAFSFIGTALAVAPALAPMLGGVLQVSFGWRWVFGFLALFGLIMWILSFKKLAETNHDLNPEALKPVRLVSIYKDLLWNRFFMAHTLVGALIFSGLFTYTATAPFLFINELGVSPEIFGILLIFTVAGYATGSYLSGRFIGVLTSRQMIILSVCISIIGGAGVLIFSGELTLTRVIAPMVIYMLGFGLNLPPSMGAALQPFPRVAGSASALMGFIQMLCAGVASLLIRFIYDATAFPLGIIELSLAIFALFSYLILTYNSSSPVSK